MDLLLFCKILY